MQLSSRASDRSSQAAGLVGLLSDGRWHSGPDLARALGVSRAAISSRAAELQSLGLQIDAVSGRGYRLKRPLELLSETAIRDRLTADVAARLESLGVFERTDSTNAELARYEDDATRACFAEYQASGRGRGGRAWASPFGANLYFSLAYTLGAARAPLGALSLAVGCRLAMMLEDLGATAIGLKWPNDLWADGRKLGGILIEHRGEASGNARVIVGLGLNIVMAAAQAGSVDQPWTRLVDHVPELPARNALAARVLEAVLGAAIDFEAEGFAGFRRVWARYDMVRDRPVRIHETAGERVGVARGIANDGALRVETGHGIETIYSGDVSLRMGA